MGVIENIEKTIALKTSLDDMDEQYLEQQREFEDKQARELAKFRKAQKEQREIFLGAQRSEKVFFKEMQDDLQRRRNVLLAKNQKFLNQSFYIRFGDLKEELIKHAKVSKSDLEATVLPDPLLQGRHSTEEISKMIMESKDHKVFVVTNLKVKGTDILFMFGNNVDFTMPQADGVPLIDCFHSTCDLKGKLKTESISFLRINPKSINDYLVKVPYRLLFDETDFSFSRYYIEIGKEYYRNYPGELFRTCVNNCVAKENKEESEEGPKKAL